MSENLRHKLNRYIYAAFDEGRDKHAIKRAGEGYGLIYSYSTRKALLDLSRNFSNYCKAINVKKVEELSPEVAESFLECKRAAGCSQASLDTYRANLGLIGDILACRGIKVNLRVNKVIAEVSKRACRGSEDIIPEEDLKKIIKYSHEHPCGSAYAIRLGCQVGVRVSDMAYGCTFDFDNKIIYIKSKGGKVCERPFNKAIERMIEEPTFKTLITEDGSLKLPKDDSINKFLRETCDKLRIERHSYHSIRRCIAQRRYDWARNNGMSRSEALRDVSIWLNHGANREKMILQSYISNDW